MKIKYVYVYIVEAHTYIYWNTTYIKQTINTQTPAIIERSYTETKS